MERAEVIKDDNGWYRVEALTADGELEVATFTGPKAKERAISFAGGDYYLDCGWKLAVGIRSLDQRRTA